MLWRWIRSAYWNGLDIDPLPSNISDPLPARLLDLALLGSKATGFLWIKLRLK
jgi:hypothetical protein